MKASVPGKIIDRMPPTVSPPQEGIFVFRGLYKKGKATRSVAFPFSIKLFVFARR
jgi:hypothetical protein